MEVLTFVKGKVSTGVLEEFRQAYKNKKKTRSADGLLRSNLLQDSQYEDLF